MTKTNNQTKYIMYCRKSTDTEDRQIQSIEDQIRELKLLAHGRDVQIIKILEESQSAKNPGRPVFNQMLDMLLTNRSITRHKQLFLPRNKILLFRVFFEQIA